MSINKAKTVALAQKYTAKGQFEKAIAEYQKALKVEPNDIRTWLKVGDLYTRLGSRKEATDTYLRVAEQYTKNGFHLKAVAVYKQVLKLDPTLVDVHQRLADSYLSLGLGSEALLQLEHLADVYQRANRPDLVMIVLLRMGEIDPKNVATRLRIAEQYSRENLAAQAVEHFFLACDELRSQGRTDDFLKVAERLLYHDESRIEIAREAAALYLDRREYKRALAKLQFCFIRDPRDLMTLRLLADAFQGLGQPDKAISVYLEMGLLLAEQGNETERRKVLEGILRLDPNNAEANEALGLSMRSASAARAPSARAAMSDSQGGLPSPASGLARSEGAAARGERARAFAEQSQSAEMETGQSIEERVEKLLTETEVLLKYGLFDRALEHLRRVSELDPYNIDAREKLKDVLLEQNQLEAAREQLFALAELFAESQPEGAIYYLHEVLKIDPGDERARQRIRDLGGIMPEELDALQSEEPEGVQEEESLEIESRAESDDELLIEESESHGFEESFHPSDPAPAPVSTSPPAQHGAYGRQRPMTPPPARHSTRPPVRPSFSSPQGSVTRPSLRFDIETRDLDDSRDFAFGEEDSDEINRHAGSEPVLDLIAEGRPSSQAPKPDSEQVAVWSLDEDVDESWNEEEFNEEEFNDDVLGEDEEKDLEDSQADDAADYDSDWGGDAPRRESGANRFGEEVEVTERKSVPIHLLAQTEIEDDLLEPSQPGRSDPREEDWGDDFPDADELAEEPAEIPRGAERLRRGKYEGGINFQTGLSDKTAPDLRLDADPQFSGIAALAAALASEMPEEPEAAPELEAAAQEREEDDISEELEEVQFYIEQGLFDEAQSMLNEIEAQHEGHSRIAEVRLVISAHLSKPPSPTAAVPAQAPASASRPSRGAPKNRGKGGPSVGVADAVDDTDFATHYDLGMAYREMGLFDKAINQFAVASRDLHKGAGAKMLIGMCLADLGRGQEAVRAFEDGLAHESLDSQQELGILYEMGKTYEALGKNADALRCFKRIGEKDPGFADVSARLKALSRGQAARPRTGAF